MAEYVAVRSNWTSLHCIPLDRVCEICIEEKDPTARMEKSEENTDEDHRLVFESKSSEVQGRRCYSSLRFISDDAVTKEEESLSSAS